MDGAGGEGDVDDDPEQVAERSAASTDPPARFMVCGADYGTRISPAAAALIFCTSFTTNDGRSSRTAGAA